MFRFIDNNSNVDIESNEFDILNYDDVILNLRILSKIKEKEKLIISNKLLNIDKRYVQGLCRYMTEDTRDDTLKHLNLILLHSFKILDDTNTDKGKVDSLTEDLKKAISGLSCLKFTYKEDEVLCSQFDLLIDKIKEKILNTYNIVDNIVD